MPTEPDDIQTYSAAPMRGINISGAEAGTEYTYGLFGMPSLTTDMAYYIEHGMNTIRFPINWQYLTDSASSTTLSSSGQVYMQAVANSVNEMLNGGLNVILDLHNYMRFDPGHYAGDTNQVVTAQQTYNVWSIISNQLHTVATAHPDSLSFEIMNEPYEMPTTKVLQNNNAGIDAIRDAGLTNMVIVEGNSWSGLHSWNSPNSDGLSNAQVLTPANIVDPLNNYAIAVHQYVDWNGSGNSPTGQDPASFVNYVKFNQFMDWVHEHNVKVILTEFGGGPEANSMANLNYLLSQVEANTYVPGEGGFLGWTAWIGGHSWAKSSFNYVGPNADGSDNVLMNQVFENHLTPTGDYDPPPPPPPVDPGDNPPPPDNDPPPNDTSPPPNNNPPPASGNVYQFNWDWGERDVITGFNAATSKLDLTQYWTSYDKISIGSDGTGNVFVELLDIDNRIITVQNVSLSDFGAKNIMGVQGNYANALDGDAKYYTFGWNYGANTVINNFDPDIGVLEFNAFKRAFSEYTITNNSQNDAVIKLDFNNQTITLKGVSADQLTADNFYAVSGSLADAYHGAAPPPVDPPPVDPPPVDPPPPPPVDPPPVDTGGNNAPAQTYSFGWNWGGRLNVSDFNPQDKLDLKPFWTNFNQMKIYEDGEGNVVVDLMKLNNQTITLGHTSLSELSANNFTGIAGNYSDAVQSQPMKLYSFSWNYGKNTVINGFDPDVGVLDLNAFNHHMSDVKIADNAHGDAVVNLAFDNQNITLTGVHANELQADNFFGV